MAVSVLYREPKLLKASVGRARETVLITVSVLYREPKLLKVDDDAPASARVAGFSALP